MTKTQVEVPAEQIQWVDGLPAPPDLPIRPFHAATSVAKLILNKEDTRQVYEVIHVLAGGAGKRLFQRFVATPYGRRVVSEPVKLEEILSNRAFLRTLPDGSVGRAYLDFMEGENLTPDGLLGAAKEAGVDYDAPTQFPEFMRLFLHINISHDLWHVLTGYGRDALGELCNLAFTRAQTKNPGIAFINRVGLVAQKLSSPGVPVLAAFREAERMGASVDFLLQHDVEALLAQPLADVRKKLGFITPSVYNAIPADVKAGVLKPAVKKTQAEREGVAAAAHA
ncbi:MAG: Coq4 family protein [Parvularculaceae bacterium]